jgi:hypothetical protein
MNNSYGEGGGGGVAMKRGSHARILGRIWTIHCIFMISYLNQDFQIHFLIGYDK